jgi:hypothetical protein
MAGPANLDPRRYVPRAGRDVWRLPRPLGYLESIQSAGSVAAPLLAGATFTLVALVLQSALPFARWQNAALLLLVGGGLAQIFAVQSVIWTRRYMTTPDDLRQWFPDDFTQGGKRPTQWLVNVQADSDQSARKWARRTRGWINAGISLLLAGIAVDVVPPGSISPMRWAVITTAWIGVAVEGTWVIGTLVGERARGPLLVCTAAIVASGGSTAAAGFAAGAGGTLATWWAVALAAVTVPLWLAVVTAARYRHGRVRLYRPLTGFRARLSAVLAPLTPVIFLLALASASRQVAGDRHQRLAALHPGIGRLLPPGVSISQHHRAVSQCTALPVTAADELARLLAASSADLPPAGPPQTAAVTELAAHLPGCVVKVVDQGDTAIMFGYYVVYPLLAAAAQAMRTGQLDADRIRPADLAREHDSCAGWYVPLVWATGARWMHRCVVATLADALAAAGAGSQARPVLAYPATSQGRALLDRYGFAPAGGEAGASWVLQK